MNTSSLVFSKFLSSVYKTLTIANQVIPLYRQVSPMVKNAKNAFSIISEISKSNKPQISKSNSNNSNKQKKELSLNNPVFFK